MVDVCDGYLAGMVDVCDGYLAAEASGYTRLPSTMLTWMFLILKYNIYITGLDLGLRASLLSNFHFNL